MAAHFSPSCLGLMGKFCSSVDLLFQVLIKFFFHRWITGGVTQLCEWLSCEIPIFFQFGPPYSLVNLKFPIPQFFDFFFDAIILIIEDSLCILLPSQTVVAIIIIIGYVSPSDAKSWIKTINDIRPPVLKITSKQDSLLLIFCSNI